MLRVWRQTVIGVATLVVATAAAAEQKKPRVPPGSDPGGIAIALITTGLDYTEPAIAACLARDGEGEVIGWDFADNDRRPWQAPSTAATTPANWGKDSTALARLIPCKAGVRIVPVRVDPQRPITLGQAIEFIAQTPARIAVLPMWSDTLSDWTAFGSAAEAFKSVLVLVSTGDAVRNLDENPAYPAAFVSAGAQWPTVSNVVTIASARGDTRTQTSTSNFGRKTVTLTVMENASDQPVRPETAISPSGRAAVDAAWSLACSSAKLKPSASADDLKRRLLELRRITPGADGRALLDPGCRNR